MQSALIVHSKHTVEFAKRLAKDYKDVRFIVVKRPPTKQVLEMRNTKDVVIGVGGGSVIDTAKIISRNKRCIAIPTTASGASMTPYATIWGREKITIPTKKPILQMKDNVPINFPPAICQSTTFDALSHAIESLWSKNSTPQSRKYSKKAIYLIMKFIKNNDLHTLITAGNMAGEAISITKTNVVHAASYPLTIEYGIDHGTACGILLPHFVKYMDFKGLPGLFNFNSTKGLVIWLRKIFNPPKIKNFNAELLADKIIKYGKINYGPREIDKKNLLGILKNVEHQIK